MYLIAPFTFVWKQLPIDINISYKERAFQMMALVLWWRFFWLHTTKTNTSCIWVIRQLFVQTIWLWFLHFTIQIQIFHSLLSGACSALSILCYAYIQTIFWLIGLGLIIWSHYWSIRTHYEKLKSLYFGLQMGPEMFLKQDFWPFYFIDNQTLNCTLISMDIWTNS